MASVILNSIEYSWDGKHLTTKRACGGCAEQQGLKTSPITQCVAIWNMWMCRPCGNNTGPLPEKSCLMSILDALEVDK